MYIHGGTMPTAFFIGAMLLVMLIMGVLKLYSIGYDVRMIRMRGEDGVKEPKEPGKEFTRDWLIGLVASLVLAALVMYLQFR